MKISQLQNRRLSEISAELRILKTMFLTLFKNHITKFQVMDSKAVAPLCVWLGLNQNQFMVWQTEEHGDTCRMVINPEEFVLLVSASLECFALCLQYLEQNLFSMR